MKYLTQIISWSEDQKNELLIRVLRKTMLCLVAPFDKLLLVSAISSVQLMDESELCLLSAASRDLRWSTWLQLRQQLGWVWSPYYLLYYFICIVCIICIRLLITFFNWETTTGMVVGCGPRITFHLSIIIFGNINIKLPEHIERNCIWYQFRTSLQMLFFDPAIWVNNLH